MLRVAESFERSDVGRQRRANEDSYFVQAPLFVVADGMGGAQAGETASRLAVEAFAAGLPDVGSSEERLTHVVHEANRRIHAEAMADSRLTGMGTTLTAAFVDEREISIAHVGDSRAYLWRDGELRPLTRDHSLVEELVRSGKLTEEQAAEHPQRSIITRALGPEPSVEPDTRTYAARHGDVFLLCSDGLTAMLSEHAIASVLRDATSLADAGRRLVDEANEAGGRDNITVVLFRLEGVSGPAVEADVEDQQTQIGQLRVDDVQAAAAETPTVQSVAAKPPKRTAPLPPRPAAPPPSPDKRGRWRPLGFAVVLLLLVGVLGAAGWYFARQNWFVGESSRGFVTVYRGLDVSPLGIPLFERECVTPIYADTIDPDRRAKVLDRASRSEEDAKDLVRDLYSRQLASLGQPTSGQAVPSPCP